MIEPDYIKEAIFHLGERTLIQSESEYMEKVMSLAAKFEYYQDTGNFNGRSEFKSEVVYAVNSCVTRDPTMHKLADHIEGME